MCPLDDPSFLSFQVFKWKALNLVDKMLGSDQVIKQLMI